MTEDVSPDHLRLFPLHDNAIARTVKSDNEYRLTSTTFTCEVVCKLCEFQLYVRFTAPFMTVSTSIAYLTT
ncbi:unnamed protein product [Adineta ricciae]|uniref:Uncharacterized protein n=1 Tax=Adineta ricciae TaxID=249248 RepID=A0A813UX13_ADIRI|nr:unnamed protein product [Adineta ricciae]